MGTLSYTVLSERGSSDAVQEKVLVWLKYRYMKKTSGTYIHLSR